MKIFKFIITAAICVELGWALNTKFGQVPPLGKFLNPSSGFWANAEAVTATPEQELTLKGLSAPVHVTYNNNLVPHIFAENNKDLYYAQGYITAQHRLFQLEFQTYAAAGRISEIIGSAALDFDRTARRKGMKYAAEQSLKGMKQDERIYEAVVAYAEGINSYINGLDYADYPVEYKLLDFQPEEWTTLKSGLLLKYMANNLNFGSDDLQNTNLLKLLGRETFDLLFPDAESYEDPIVENIGGWDFEPIVKDSLAEPAIAEFIRADLVEDPNPLNGSNNWAVGPEKTASGHAILSSDPHLGLNLPSLWYMMQLQSPDVNVLGATLPGSPNVIIGFNDSIAWGVTNAQRDLVDWFKIDFKDDSKTEYKLDGTWVKSEPVIEEIKLRGEPTYYDTVYYTHFGPVMYDDSFRPDSERKFYALRWIAHDVSGEALAFYLLNRAKNHGDYMAALNNYVSPAQNFAFASASGDIAIRVQGKYPLKGYEVGKFLQDGTTSANDWTFIPNAQNVMYKNPERGFIASANQYPVDSTYPYYIHASSYEMYRNRRINSRLSEMSDITPDDLMKLQNDNYNLKATESLPYFLEALEGMELSDEEQSTRKVLVDWDYYNELDAKGASLYEMWWDTLIPLLWDEMIGQDMALSRPTTYTTIKLLKEQPDLAFFDNASTPEVETGPDMIRKSFQIMVKDILEWQKINGEANWAAYKGTYINHLLRLAPFSEHDIPIGGNHGIVNATSENHGPSWRMVVTLDPQGVEAYGVYPGGQSGNPGSRFYDNMIADWAAGEYQTLHLRHQPDDNPEEIMVQQTLTPEK